LAPRASPTAPWLVCAALCACTARNPAFHARATTPDGAEEQLAPRPDGAAPALDEAPALDAAPALDEPPGPPDAAPDRPAPIVAGLVARWRLDPTGGSSAPDETGANDGALQGGATWSGMAVPSSQFDDRGSLQFDGVDDAVTLGNATLPALEHAKSISLWFWIGATPATPRQDLIVLSNPTRLRSVQLGIEAGRIALWTWNRAIGSATIYAPGTVQPGWHHLGYTFDGSRHTLYLLGSSAGSSTENLGTGPITRALLGTFDATSDVMERFKGFIDDVRIYDRSLDGREMSDLAAGAP
jgi:hypothetical protein